MKLETAGLGRANIYKSSKLVFRLLCMRTLLVLVLVDNWCSSMKESIFILNLKFCHLYLNIFCLMNLYFL